MTQSTRQRSKIKDQVGIEREIKKLWYILFHFIAIDFVLLLETCLQNIVLLFHKQSIYLGPLQASVLFP